MTDAARLSYREFYYTPLPQICKYPFCTIFRQNFCAKNGVVDFAAICRSGFCCFCITRYVAVKSSAFKSPYATRENLICKDFLIFLIFFEKTIDKTLFEWYNNCRKQREVPLPPHRKAHVGQYAFL